jgi:ATP-binding cassette, subfamily B, bacterial
VSLMQSLTKQTIRIFWDHSKRYRWPLFAIGLSVIAIPIWQVYIPLLYRDLLNLLAEGFSPDVFNGALRLVFIILALNFGETIFWRGINFVTNFFQPAVMRDLNNTCYEYLQKHSFGFFTSNFVGSLVTKVRRYERAFEKLADQITYDIGNSLMLTVFIITTLFIQYSVFGWIMLIWGLIFIFFSFIYARFKLPYDIEQAKADTRVTAQLADSITNNANIKLFKNYEMENERFGSVTKRRFRLRKRSWDLGTLGDTIQAFLMVILEFVVIYLALTMWRDGLLGVGDVALLQTFLFRIFGKLWNIGRNFRYVYEAFADANEMTELLLEPHGIIDEAGAKSISVSKGEIDFKNVEFGYHDGVSVLEKFSLTIAPGERVALIGPSGGGKSTIVKLLFRLYDVDGGAISIDGEKISAVTQDSLRSVLSLVPQDPILFHRSLIDNIRYARPTATDKEVIEAAKQAHADEFISSFPKGYDTLVGERGVKLSGGERQRVAIARAILKNAPILVLDEATSSLDSESERYIQESLKDLMKDRTTIVIAHRLSTIMQMDRIVVVENGKITEEGKHEELLKVQEGTYQRLWEIQAGGFSAT